MAKCLFQGQCKNIYNRRSRALCLFDIIAWLTNRLLRQYNSQTMREMFLWATHCEMNDEALASHRPLPTTLTLSLPETDFFSLLDLRMIESRCVGRRCRALTWLYIWTGSPFIWTGLITHLQWRAQYLGVWCHNALNTHGSPGPSTTSSSLVLICSNKMSHFKECVPH